MTAFRCLVFMGLAGLITAPIPPSSNTTGLMAAPAPPAKTTADHVTLRNLVEGEMFGNVTGNQNCCQENFEPYDDDEKEEMSASDNSQRLFTTIEARIYRIYFPIVTLMNGFSCTTTILTLWKSNHKSSAEVYILGIGVANMIAVINYVFYTFSFFEVFTTNRHWQTFYSYYMVFLLPFSFIALMANTWTVMALGIERFLAIRFPFKARVICNRSRAVKVVIGIFILTCLINGTRFFMKRVQVEIDPITNETVHKRVFTEFGRNWLAIRIQYCFYAIAGVILPVILLGVLNIAILVTLRTVGREQIRLKEGITDSERCSNIQIERVLIAYMSAFFLCNVMSATTVGTVAFRGFVVVTEFNLDFRIRALISNILYVLNPTVNFIAYVGCSKIHRTTVKRCFRALCFCRRPFLNSSSCTQKPPAEGSSCPTVSGSLPATATEIQRTKA